MRSCTLTPDAAAGALSTRSLIICGCPRSGTALMTAALFQPPSIATVMEPWDGLRLAPLQLFGEIRQELAGGELRRGRLRIDRLLDNGEVLWQRDGENSYDVHVDDGAVVGIKWPTYWQLLGRVTGAKFVVCVRDPAEVVRSFEQQGGRLSQGLEYDVAFNSDLNRALLEQHHTDEARRLGLYDTANERVLRHADEPNVFLARYERWFADPSGLLADLSDFLGVDVTEAPVRIRPPRSVPEERHSSDIRRRSTTAHRLGYG